MYTYTHALQVEGGEKKKASEIKDLNLFFY